MTRTTEASIMAVSTAVFAVGAAVLTLASVIPPRFGVLAVSAGGLWTWIAWALRADARRLADIARRRAPAP